MRPLSHWMSSSAHPAGEIPVGKTRDQFPIAYTYSACVLVCGLLDSS